MKENNIKGFSIIGLFGTNDVKIIFEEDVKILIGENGIGKTQVLNLFYYTLQQDFLKLWEFNFKEIIIDFDFEKINITRERVGRLIKDVYKNPLVKDFIEEFGYSYFEHLRNLFIKFKGNRIKFEKEIGLNYKTYKKLPLSRALRVFEHIEFESNNLFNSELLNIGDKIRNAIKGYDILYFPTYRRVEEELHIIGYDEEKISFDDDKTLIQFGMDDVQRRFDFVQEKIDKLAKEGFAQFTKDILNVVLEDVASNDDIFDKINEDDIEIILSRVGNLLSQTQKDSVKSTVVNKVYKNPLSGYLLQKLVDIYEKQKSLDTAIKEFRDVCNRYLLNKEVYYDESAIRIYVKSNITGKEIKLNKLSSGEKQIVSIFSKVYLPETLNRFIVLFDEPELSLSMLWQRQLLPDIINSKKCALLIAVTHSPFIFDNELDKYAVGLSEYISDTTEIIEYDEPN